MSPGLLPTTRPPPRALYHVQCPRTRRPPPLAFCMKRRPIIAAVTVSYAIGGITLVEVLSCCSHGRCQRAQSREHKQPRDRPGKLETHPTKAESLVAKHGGSFAHLGVGIASDSSDEEKEQIGRVGRWHQGCSLWKLVAGYPPPSWEVCSGTLLPISTTRHAYLP